MKKLGPDRAAISSELSLILAGAGRLAVCGIGNELRGDDAAGVLVARRLRALASSRDDGALRKGALLRVWECGERPEDALDEIAAFAPSHAVFVDAADAGIEAGGVVLLEIEEIDSTCLSSHSIPLSFYIGLLAGLSGPEPPEVRVIGIQAAQCAIGSEPSPEVSRSIDLLAECILAVFSGL